MLLIRTRFLSNMANTVHSKKEKGRRLERWWAEILKHRGLEPFAYARADSGSGAKKEDVTVHFLPIHTECKNQESWSLGEFWKQTISGCPPYHYPVLILSKNRFPRPLALMYADELVDVFEYAIKGGWIGNTALPKKIVKRVYERNKTEKLSWRTRKRKEYQEKKRQQDEQLSPYRKEMEKNLG